MPARALAKRLRNSPLVQVLVQVRFAPVLDMGERISALQREFKAAGFPRYQELQVPRLIAVQAGAVPEITLGKLWHFQSPNRDSAITLSTDQVALATSKYDLFEHFLEPFLRILTSARSMGSVELIDRIGLRYVNLIRPRDGESIGDYVQQSLLGISESALQTHGARRVGLHSEARFAIRDGSLVLKLLQLGPGTALPPDLNPVLVNSPAPTGPTESVFALDCDHYRENLSATLEIDFVDRMLWELHGAAWDAFSAAVTPHALQVWGPIEDVKP